MWAGLKAFAESMTVVAILTLGRRRPELTQSVKTLRRIGRE